MSTDLCIDIISSWFPPLSFHTFSTRFHLIPACPFVIFSHTALWQTLFFSMFRALYCHFNFLTSRTYLFQVVYSLSALPSVVLVGLEHPSNFFICVLFTAVYEPYQPWLATSFFECSLLCTMVLSFHLSRVSSFLFFGGGVVALFVFATAFVACPFSSLDGYHTRSAAVSVSYTHLTLPTKA